MTNLQIEDPILGNLIANWKTIQVIKSQLALLECSDDVVVQK